ncbi:FadR/GntR family transcriptional regulator [Dactylosporangium sp. AC04546]|uniref:FadR/GntR family transcriptional regulator n=1 Tax=Dactylosporangium sp. AC04546 TaxID=2862460 RepID=UPI001EDD2B15|nr:FadR/GntR family transcriptional regulator [Dactylosporangium sp. AC04546]WVK81080.1 FadR/GntR family transcriptional regulator [Dactylosporangium sp. AC04546]
MKPAPLPQFSLSVRESVEAELTRKLLDYLLSGSLHPGQRIPPERALAEALGVGRAAIRNSIKALVLLGLLDQRQGDGTYLSRTESDLLPKVIEWGLLLGQHRIADIMELRQHLEVILAVLAAERRTPEQLEEMRGHITEMEAAATDYERYVEADIAFHLAMARASGNEVMAGVLSNAQSLLRVWATRVIRAADETETSLAMHIPVLDAIEAQEPEKARAAMTALMERAARRLRRSLPQAEAD